LKSATLLSARSINASEIFGICPTIFIRVRCRSQRNLQNFFSAISFVSGAEVKPGIERAGPTW
jgi:hypothetical protein